MIKKLILVLMVAMLLFSIVACSSNNEPLTNESPDDVVAIVNSKEIMRKDFDRALMSIKNNYLQYGIDFDNEEHADMLEVAEEEALYNLIQEELLLQKASERTFDYTKEDVAFEIEQLKAELEGEEEFEKLLELNQLTLEELEIMIYNDNIISRYIHEEIGELTVTDEELLAIYDEYSEFVEDMPEFDEVKDQLADEVRYEKYMMGLEDLLERLMDESEIEILI
ncbi:SurA N-terminal domain-containing protein [Alkaliphilus transvaalensis]|uniref:SurA N-terminal domain-containing protein n=1 Tax=Alkaliphilus transvaalensis TaxID=114628 RepID=UPI00047BB934|nr:SurA N-terminal domain-containing protein [Alkaliphilus transvaalensis]